MTKDEYWKLYKYPYDKPKGIYGVDYVTCPICNNDREFKTLTQHLRMKHNMTPTQFLTLYPNKKITTTYYRDLQSKKMKKTLNKLWQDETYRSKMLERATNDCNFLKAPMTEEKRQQRSEVASKVLKELWKTPEYREKKVQQAVNQHKDGSLTKAVVTAQRNNWIKYTTWENQEVTLKSSYELKLASFLDQEKIPYEYEKIFPYYDTQKKKKRKYYSDFYLKEYDIVLEVKASWAIDSRVNVDKMLGVLKTGTKFMFFTEQELGSLVSKKEFIELIQSNINV